MQELSENDFFQGLIAALAIKGVRNASIRTENFDPVLRAVFERFEERAPSYDVEVDFEITPDPTHKDSLTVSDALAASAGDGLISYDNPKYLDIEIKLQPHGATTLLQQRFPSLRPLFDELAELFVQRYAATPFS